MTKPEVKNIAMYHPTSEFTCSTKTGAAGHFDAILALGQKIVQEFDRKGHEDTLSQWMAHYVADLMQGAISGSGAERAQRVADCSKAILELWAHRSQFPDGKRPFEDFEPVLRVMRSLDPSDQRPRYFPAIVRSAGEDGNSEAAPWLRAALRVDSVAKVLIRYCLDLAMTSETDKSREWLAVAESISNDPDIDVESLRAVFVDQNPAPPDDRAHELARIEEKLEKLDAFDSFAKAIRTELEKERERFQTPGLGDKPELG
jgi:hypothetical protein